MIVNSQSYLQRGDHKTEEIIIFAFSIHDIENMYLKEEENHVENLTNLFNESWQGISIIGDKYVSELVGLFQGSKHQMSKEVLQLSRLQTRSVVYDWRFLQFFLKRERHLRFAFSLEAMASIPAPEQHSLLQRNLACTEMMVPVFAFNINSVEEEMEFIYSQVGCLFSEYKIYFSINIPFAD